MSVEPVASIFAHPNFDDHEQVIFSCDPVGGLHAIIAVHNTARGPALGGCRIWPYESEAAALTDVLRLSRGMTYKAAMAGVPFGGGKAVVIADPIQDKSVQLLKAIGHAIERLRGRYITGEDVGTTADDMIEIGNVTSHVFGLPEHLGGSGDPSGSTALGCFVGIQACAAYKLQRDRVEGLRVAVQGLGNVGRRLCGLLHDAGAQLIVSDIHRVRAVACEDAFGAQIVSSDAIFEAAADVFAPCALGGILNDDTIPRLTARVIAGAANNQLATDAHAARLHERGILYAPDYVINAGGMIQLASERTGASKNELEVQIRAIEETLLDIFRRADAAGTPTLEAANAVAQARFRRA